ncbi:PP2C family protein-serine/threonine phosphatase [Leptolyngbya sp. AN03gr2]|uniref:PP2C family protein-serine/threonine phosphatase n=1 Tax=unclassified Leptolyngbya TaxID=2650499 RepID=UPI003D30F3F1
MNSSGKLFERAATTTIRRFQSQGFHYLWAVGTTAGRKKSGTTIADRYQVKAPQIWLDTQPENDPQAPLAASELAQTYLLLYPYRLHVPEVYGVCRDGGDEILLLENVPITESGELQPSIAQVWYQGSATRQIYWLWQMLELWTPLKELGVASSLLSPDFVRIEGWRIRLKELILDEGQTQEAFAAPTLANLAQSWAVLLPDAKPAIAEQLQALCALMQTSDVSYREISTRLNVLLLEQASQLPLRIQVHGATEVGKRRSHNEDSCYPIASRTQTFDDLSAKLTIVCDGIGGHDGGEVASQLAVQSIQLQVKALLSEIAGQPEPLPPDLICDQLAAIVRVVNNLIAAQNDAQNRTARRRMGTTLVMALQIPQRVTLPGGSIANNAHEVYLVNVGDSRAYWITPEYCHQLTVDDDVAVREVRMGRSLYREALKRPDSGALTQAMGTREGHHLHPSVRRFILEEDGMLVLCSDGMSDNGFVEQSWADYAELILQEKFSIESAVQSWLDFADQRNGHDNASIVLTHCQVSAALPEMRLPLSKSISSGDDPELPEPIVIPPTEVVKPKKKNRIFLKSLLVLLLGGGAALGTWYYRDPVGMQQRIRTEAGRIQPTIESLRQLIPNDLLKR